MINIEIDNGSGFCFGVTTAIRKAEEELASGEADVLIGRHWFITASEVNRTC